MTEHTFSSMRAAMVESQLRPSDVDDTRVIAVMAHMPREVFVPAARQSMAYIDRSVPLDSGRALNPPLATARLLSELRIAPGEKVLLIGAATGYCAALLAALGASVTAVEEADGPDTAAHDGVKVVRGALVAGAPAAGPYDVLLIDGAVADVPVALIDQLAEGARVATGIVERGVTRLSVGRKVAGRLGLSSLADMEMVVLPGFAAPERFVF